jgi:hypothetical protein
MQPGFGCAILLRNRGFGMHRQTGIAGKILIVFLLEIIPFVDKKSFL